MASTMTDTIKNGNISSEESVDDKKDYISQSEIFKGVVENGEN